MLYLFLILCNFDILNAQYEVPEATVIAYDPQGFSVSIPDQEGVQLFAFHGKINEEMEGREAGTFSRDITAAKNGYWTFNDQSTKLKIGDRIYFWTFVIYGPGRLGFAKDNQEFTVTELIKKESGNTPGTAPVKIPEMTTVKAPGVAVDACEPTVTVKNGGTSTCKGKLIFNEPFNVEIRSKYWNIENRLAGKPDYEFTIYTDRPETMYIIDKTLVIQPELAENVYGGDFVEQSFDFGERCTGTAGSSECRYKPDAGFILPPVLSAKITTLNKFSFKYGKIEVKAKLPKGDWLYPILTLNPVYEEYGPDYESGQIRIAFSPGNKNLNKNVYGGVILGSTTLARNYGMKHLTKQAGWSTDFHRFGVTWKEDQITLTVNDKVYGTVVPPFTGFSSLASMLNIKSTEQWKKGSFLAPFDKEMYITVGVGAGGFNFEDKTDGTKPWRNGERLSMKKFHAAQSNWSSTWNAQSVLSVSYIKDLWRTGTIKMPPKKKNDSRASSQASNRTRRTMETTSDSDSEDNEVTKAMKNADKVVRESTRQQEEATKMLKEMEIRKILRDERDQAEKKQKKRKKPQKR